MVDVIVVLFIDLHSKTQEELKSVIKENGCTWRTWIKLSMDQFFLFETKQDLNHFMQSFITSRAMVKDCSGDFHLYLYSQ